MKKLWLVFLMLLIATCAWGDSVPHESLDLLYRGEECPECPDCGVQETMERMYEGGVLSNTFIEGDKAYMNIYLNISDFTAKDFWNDIAILKLRDIKNIELYISSGGGNATAGLALADQIEMAKRSGFTIVAHASGIIASATVPVFAVCSKRYAAEGTIFMVHEASIFKFFSNESKSDIKSQNALMELLTKKYMDKMTKYSNLTIEQWEEYERETTWFDAHTAKEWGLVDKVE